MPAIKPNDKVLHVSFADAAFGRADVFAGTFSKKEIANKTFKPLEKNTTMLPFKDKSFDFVYCTHTLQYVDHPMKIIDEVRRICKSAQFIEHSEFAEYLFGWPDHKWIVSVEDNSLVVKQRTDRYGRFGPLFHGYYQDDPVFSDCVASNTGLFKVAVDWYEEDDQKIVEEYEEEEFVVPEEGSNEAAGVKVVKKTKEIVKPVFRPCQTEYFDEIRYEIGKISQDINVRHLKTNKLL